MLLLPTPRPSWTSRPDFSVNNASARGGYDDGSEVLAAGASTNPAGAFVGGGVGNKAIRGIFGFNGLPIGSLASIEFEWTNVVGPAGPNYLPAEPVTVCTPYVNLVVDFGGGDLRVCVLLSDQQAPAVSAALGTYVNDGLNVLTYSWDGTSDAVSIVNAPPNPVPGGVLPVVDVGPSWLDKAYSWAALVAANPTAMLVDAYPADGGLPAGSVMPAILLVSGDSANVTRTGKRIARLSVNGTQVWGP